MNSQYNLNMSRIYKCDAKTLFQAIADGLLFKFTGAPMDKAKVDFREGGKFHLEWPKANGTLDGEFKQIVPHSKIVFTWPTLSKDTKEQISTLVTISIQENYGKSILTLKHEGFDGFITLNAHDFGWDDALGDLRKSFRELIAKMEKNTSGLDLYFKIKKTIHAPRAKVYAAYADHKQLNQYFGCNSTTDFVAGNTVEWNFPGYPTQKLVVKQAVPGEMISFQWGEAVVCFSFRDKGPGETELVMESTGYAATQEGLDHSYKECEGWQNVLDKLAVFLVGKL